jgi:hypothetical protein
MLAQRGKIRRERERGKEKEGRERELEYFRIA